MRVAILSAPGQVQVDASGVCQERAEHDLHVDENRGEHRQALQRGLDR